MNRLDRDSEQGVAVELTREEIELVNDQIMAGLCEDTVETPAPFALKVARDKLRAALTQQHSGDDQQVEPLESHDGEEMTPEMAAMMVKVDRNRADDREILRHQPENLVERFREWASQKERDRTGESPPFKAAANAYRDCADALESRGEDEATDDQQVGARRRSRAIEAVAVRRHEAEHVAGFDDLRWGQLSPERQEIARQEARRDLEVALPYLQAPDPVEGREEWRVMSLGAVAHSDKTSAVVHERGIAESIAFEQRRHFPNVWIQSRTVTSTEWRDVPNE